MPVLRVQENQAAVELPMWMQEPIQAIVAATPRILGALVVLFIGWLFGLFIGSLVTSLVDRVELDRRVVGTPLGRMMGEDERAVSRTFGKVAKWFVYALAILAAANILAISMLSQWISVALSYVPAFLAGLLIIVLGFILADFIGDIIERTQMATNVRYTRWFADGVRVLLYFMAIVIGLDTMGVEVALLYIFAGAAAFGLGLALALALGIGLGWGSKDYVSQHIEEWMQRTRQEAEEAGEG